MEYCLNLSPFYENFQSKTALNGSIIEVAENGKRYKVERWMKGESHCLVFICITPGTNNIFAAKPSQIEKAIKSNTITIVKYI